MCKGKNYLGEKLLFAILIVILLSPFIYIFKFHPGSGFWDNAVGNLLATVLALVAGIPVALLIDRSARKKDDDDKFKIDRLKEKEILTLVKEELNFNLNSLFLPGKKNNTGTMTIQPLKSDLWDALVASEGIKQVESPHLLNRVTSAYYVLKVIKNIEYQAFIALRTSAIVFTDSQGKKANAAQLLLQDARTFDVLFENSLREALKMIDERIDELKKYEI